MTDFEIRNLPEQATVVRRALVPAADLQHIGPYEGLAATWMAMQEWGGEQGLPRSGDSFGEVYVSDPGAEPDPRQWRTQLVQPVESPCPS